MEKNIILCGFMGSGKSTVGQSLHQRLSLTFVDLDQYIEEKHSIVIPLIFQLYGQDYFRELEHQACLDFTEKRGIILATGGGTVTFERNVKALSQNGVIIFIDTPFAECFARIENTDRPLVAQNDKASLNALFEQRRAIYQRVSHYSVYADTCEELTDRIVELVRPAVDKNG